MNFSAPKQKITPPERGSFPLDHGGECKPFAQEFMACLKSHGNEHVNCKQLSKKYLECRQNRGLMACDDLSQVGFGDSNIQESREKRIVLEGKKEEQGFVAGMHIEQRSSWLPFRWTPRGGGH
mmetsp:Transcript_20347/g.26366  ORF Transcript_20347/g.26366 Transcript_20347/m.26366 type:complete len:123 (+) Transcript_20347:102-470(+)